MGSRLVSRSAGVRLSGSLAERLPVASDEGSSIWVVVKSSVPFWVPVKIRHLLFKVPKKGP